MRTAARAGSHEVVYMALSLAVACMIAWSCVWAWDHERYEQAYTAEETYDTF
jgi:hypothetical protein